MLINLILPNIEVKYGLRQKEVEKLLDVDKSDKSLMHTAKLQLFPCIWNWESPLPPFLITQYLNTPLKAFYKKIINWFEWNLNSN